MKPLFLLALLSSQLAFGQFTDSFSDGNFTENPRWTNADHGFEISSDNQLHLNAVDSLGHCCISTLCPVVKNASWRFSVKFGFNPSSSNFARVYLITDSPDQTDSVHGYFVMIGGTADEISLYKQAGKTSTKLIDGLDKWLDKSSVDIRIAVSLDDSGNWLLTADTNKSGQFVHVGTAIDQSVTHSSYFSVYTRFTSTRADKFWFDDFEVSGDIENDPPKLVSHQAFGLDTIELLFDEPLESTSTTKLENYRLGESFPLTVNHENNWVRLVFPGQVNGSRTNLSISALADLNGNFLVDTIISIRFCDPETMTPNDLIFNEIFPDPTPVVGLPNAEFVELYNRSNKVLNLGGVRLTNSGHASELPAHCVLPGDYVILCNSKDSLSFAAFGSTLGLNNWSTLTNAADSLAIYVQNQLISSVNYTADWFDKNSPKAVGGYSLELIDAELLCRDSPVLWRFSENSTGGTPGKANLGHQLPESDSLTALFLYLNDEGFRVSFNEPILNSGTWRINESAAAAVFPGNPASNFILLKSAFNADNYSITVDSVFGCFSSQTTHFSFAFSTPDSGYNGLVINELLYDPPGDESDFVEVFNSGKSWLSLAKLNVSSVYPPDPEKLFPIDSLGLLLAPGDYLVLTENPASVKEQFPQSLANRLFAVDVPNFPNGDGHVLLCDHSLNLIDHLIYSDKLHSAYLHETEGVSLERKQATQTNTADNWTSATAAANYATPGFLNSAGSLTEENSGFEFSTELITPNGDGSNDELTIRFQTDESVSLTIDLFSASGIQVKNICKEQPVGSNSVWSWNATDKNNNPVPAGIYVVYAEVFNGKLTGVKVKKVVVVSR